MVKKLIVVLFLAINAQENYYPNYYPLIIVGGGVAGYSCAIYGGNARIPTAVFVGPRPGGQLAVAGMVENMPGVLPRYGYLIIEQLEAQARTFGAQIYYQTIATIVKNTQSGPRFTLTTDEGTTYHADALIIATGSRPRTLEVPGESEFWGRGVSTCAICDCTLAQDNDVVIIGGGDAAIEEALQLAPYAKSITLLLRGTSFRASPRMQEKLLLFDHISYRYDSQLCEIVGDTTGIQSVTIYHKVTDQFEKLSAQAVFFAIGHIPETDLVRDLVECDAAGFILLKDRQRTSVEGIFAAGDVTDNRYRQAIVASGDAAKAALDAIAFLRGIY